MWVWFNMQYFIIAIPGYLLDGGHIDVKHNQAGTVFTVAR